MGEQIRYSVCQWHSERHSEWHIEGGTLNGWGINKNDALSLVLL